MQNKHTVVRIQTEHGLAHIDVDRVLSIYPSKWGIFSWSRMEVTSFAEPGFVTTIRFHGPAIFCFVGGEKNL